jgi:hypothetical protein
MPRKLKPLEVLGYLVASVVISAAGLWALPFVITALGAAAPFAVATLFIRYLLRRRPWFR